MYLPYISQYFLGKYCTVKGSGMKNQSFQPIQCMVGNFPQIYPCNLWSRVTYFHSVYISHF